MELDALLLARIQFGFTVSFHIIFPAITIGLASYLAVLEGCWLRTKKSTAVTLCSVCMGPAGPSEVGGMPFGLSGSSAFRA